MTSTFLLGLALVAPALSAPQNLLDLVVQHATAREVPLLVPADIAKRLEAVTPTTLPDRIDQALLGDWLARRNAAITGTATGGLVVYQPGSEAESVLLEVHAPWVGVDELADWGQTLVWTSAPPTGAEVNTPGLIEVRIGNHRALGGQAHQILARIGMHEPPIEVVALHPAARATAQGGTPVLEWIERHEESDPDLVVTYTHDFATALQDQLIWNAGDLEDLHRLGLGTVLGGPDARIFELSIWTKKRRGYRGVSVFTESLDDARKLSPMTIVQAVLEFTHLDAREVSDALLALPLGPLVILAAGKPRKRIILLGEAHSVCRWWSWLREIDR